jgi:hypothetical protein
MKSRIQGPSFAAEILGNVLNKRKRVKLAPPTIDEIKTLLNSRDQPLIGGLCSYDGIKFRSYDKDVISWFKDKSQRILFKFKETITHEGHFFRLDGKYENLEIQVYYTPQDWVAEISGSLHVFYNKIADGIKHNYNDFHWDELKRVFDVLTDVFSTRIWLFNVVNLEIGRNYLIPTDWPVQIGDVLEHMFLFHGKCNNKTRIQTRSRDSFSVQKGETYMKLYHKSLQYKLKVEQEILRAELGFDRSRQIYDKLQVTYLFELFLPETHLRCLELLRKTFASTLILQPGFIENMPIEEIVENRSLINFANSSYWCVLRKNKRKYDKHLRLYNEMIRKYCSYNMNKLVQDLFLTQ